MSKDKRILYLISLTIFMIQKIKDLMKISESLDEIKGKVDDHHSSVSALKEEMQGFKDELKIVKENLQALHKKQSIIVDDFQQSLARINELNSDFKSTIYDFTILRKDLQNQVLQKFDEKLNDELINHIDDLKNNAAHYKELKEKMASMVTRIKTLSDEIVKFKEISKNIRKEDFELTKYAHIVTQLDKEKLNLMKKVDTLESLIAKMRRTGP
jgi:predicted nuclease with TOPRIM domain